MSGHEVDAGRGLAAVALVQVARAGEPVGQIANAGGSAPEITHRVAEGAVPFSPAHWEVADLVAAGDDVPRFGDEFHARQHRVLVDDVEECREPINVVELARES